MATSERKVEELVEWARDHVCDGLLAGGRVVVVLARTDDFSVVKVGVDRVGAEGGAPREVLVGLVQKAVQEYVDQCPNMVVEEKRNDL